MITGLNPTANRRQQGFTIVESLIVLAITGVLFVSMSVMIQGQIDSYQRRDAMLQLEAVIRSTLNDVSNGYYPDLGQKINSCNTNGNKTQVTNVSLAAVGSNLGTNQDCVFAGKKITFTPNNITIDTLVSGAQRTSLPSAPADVYAISQMQEIKNYRWGIKPTTATGSPVIYLLNTAYSPQTASSGGFASGTQSVQLFDVNFMPIQTNTAYCFDNGGVKSSLTILGSSLQVESKAKDTCL